MNDVPEKTFAQLSWLKLPISLRSKAINMAPQLLRPALSILPFSFQKKVILPALHSIFKEAIADGDFDFLQNKWLKISIIDLNLHWLISIENTQLIMAEVKEETKYDVSFSATGDDLVLIAGRKQDPDTLFFQRRLSIEGDTELGLEVKNLIDAIELEQLPSIVHKWVNNCANFIQQTRDEMAM